MYCFCKRYTRFQHGSPALRRNPLDSRELAQYPGVRRGFQLPSCPPGRCLLPRQAPLGRTSPSRPQMRPRGWVTLASHRMPCRKQRPQLWRSARQARAQAKVTGVYGETDSILAAGDVEPDHPIATPAAAVTPPSAPPAYNPYAAAVDSQAQQGRRQGAKSNQESHPCGFSAAPGAEGAPQARRAELGAAA